MDYNKANIRPFFMSGLTLGIDVGGTKIAAGLVTKQGKLSQLTVVPTSHENLRNQIFHLVESFDGFSVIGLGLPGRVLDSGMVNRLPNIRNYEPTNFKTLLERRFKVPVAVVNDTKAFAFAESLKGDGKKFRIVAGVILGTGIAVGLVIDKQIYFGENSLAGEMGHFIMPNRETFEKYVRHAGKFKKARDAKKYLRLLLNYIVRSFDPQIIVLGGGWSTLPGMEQVWKELVSEIRKPNKTLVKVSKLKHAGLIGAALFAMKQK